VEDETFLINHVLQDLFGRLEAVPRPIKHLFADNFLLLVVEAVEIGMR